VRYPNHADGRTDGQTKGLEKIKIKINKNRLENMHLPHSPTVSLNKKPNTRITYLQEKKQKRVPSRFNNFHEYIHRHSHPDTACTAVAVDFRIAAVVGEVETLAVGFHKLRAARAAHVLDTRYILAAGGAGHRCVVRKVYSSDNLWSFKLAKKL